jgi:Tetratricopeptide repeat
MMRVHSLLPWLVVGSFALAVGTAHATPPTVPDQARQLAARGRIAHESGDYSAAIAAYTEAYALAPSPALLFNLAQAYRLRGTCDEARLMYRRYLDTDPSPEARVIAEGHLANVETCVHASSRSDARTGTTTSTSTSEPGLFRRRAGLGFVVGGGLSLLAATYFAIDAKVAERDVERGYASGGSGSELAPIDTRGQRNATLATWFGIGGGALVAVGVTTYLLGRHAAERATPFAVTPRKGGAEVSVAWRF